jgi:EAL domain-containing protein (putative c-di-GMP-specific phosphodiesterase class I)
VGFEALMRWLHPEQGLIPLNEFLPMLESSSLMIEVGLQIFQQIVDTQRQWQLAGCHLPISFNVSNGELLSKSFRDGMIRMVRQAGLSPQDMGLEITESVLADLGEAGHEIVEELRQEGFQLSMDDFGVGTSSLSRLRNIPLNEIKVDRSFIVGIVDSDRNLDLLRGIVNLGHSLGLKVVLEGVETLKEYELACTLGDLVIQGFYYSKAVDSQAALVLAQQQPFTVH